MNDQLFLLGDVAELLDVKPYKVAYLYLTRKLPEPKLRLGNRRVFTTADVEAVAKTLHLPCPNLETEECSAMR
jgi:hypothetical protein